MSPKRAVLVFAGPSLSREDRALWTGFEFRPPVAGGDIFRAMPERPAAIAVIDGLFHDRIAVLHKELLAAMANGTAVYGAASMGALRAAELAVYGMVGVGAIFTSYREGRRLADDEVSVLHGPAEARYAPLSVAFVDIEATLLSLTARGRLSEREKATLLGAAKTLHYSQRTWERLAEAGAGALGSDPEPLAKMMRRAHVQAKRLDAIALLERLSRDASDGWQLPLPSYQPPETPAFRAARARYAPEPGEAE